jgi:hypothetical protein
VRSVTRPRRIAIGCVVEPAEPVTPVAMVATP